LEEEMANTVLHPLEPVFDKASRILILGTMPSVKSREAGFYYMNPQNRFWSILCEILREPLPDTADERRMLVLGHGIALWDVLRSCEIEGSADDSIRNPVANDFSIVFQTSRIRAVFTTGTRATRLYRSLAKENTGMDCIPLPSTSPANRRYLTEEEISHAWRIIIPYLS
jgi:TDG/mug DNA glycosylase family protein